MELISIHSGSRNATYDIEPSATDVSKPAFATLSAVNITVSKIVGVGMTLTRGKKDIPPALTGNRAYALQVSAASDWHVIMHDTYDRRAWLLDGASALVHISIARLYSCDELERLTAEANGESGEEFSPKADQLKYPPNYEGRQSALKVLLNNENRELRIFPETKLEEEVLVRDSDTGNLQRTIKQTKTWWCWKDLVTEKFAILELLHDQSFRKRHCPATDIKLPFGPRSIEGFEFGDIVQGCSPLQPRVTRLDASYGDWLDFSVEIDAIILFGSGFGELIKPAEVFSGAASKVRCGQRASCPADHDYLAAPISVLTEIHKKCRSRKSRSDNCLRLSEKTFWHDALVPMEHCNCASKRCSIKTAKLQSASASARQSAVQSLPDEVFKRYARGAIVFGSGNTHSITSARDSTPATPRKVPTQKPAKGKERDSGIDMGDSSSNSNMSPTSPRANTPPDSGVGTDGTRRHAWVRVPPSVAESTQTESSQHGRSNSDSPRQHTGSLRPSRTPSKPKKSGWASFFEGSQTSSKQRHSSNDNRQAGTRGSQSGRSSNTGNRRERDGSPARSTSRRQLEDPKLSRR